MATSPGRLLQSSYALSLRFYIRFYIILYYIIYILYRILSSKEDFNDALQKPELRSWMATLERNVFDWIVSSFYIFLTGVLES